MQNLLPQMARMAGNSQLTQELVHILEEKLSDEEQHTMHRWLKHLELSHQTAISREKRKT